MDRAELKARARAQLGGGIFQNLWMMGLAVCLLIGLMESAAAGILPGIGALIVVGPLEYGMAFIFLKQARDHQPVQLGDMFRGFQDDFGGTFLIGLMTSLFTFLWSLLFIIPGIIAGYRYRFALYNLCENPEMGVMEALNMSKAQTRGHKWELFVLDLSFLGWIILCGLTLGILSIWIMPYIQQTDIGYFQAIKQMSGVGCQPPRDDGEFHADDRFGGGPSDWNPER